MSFISRVGNEQPTLRELVLHGGLANFSFENLKEKRMKALQTNVGKTQPTVKQVLNFAAVREMKISQRFSPKRG